MKRTSTFTLLLLFLILVAMAAVTFYVFKKPADALHSAAKTNLQTNEKAVYTDLQGNPFTFKAYEGQVRVVNAWASWVPFSTAELKNFEILATQYKDKNVAVIAVNRKEPKEQAQRFLDSLQTFQNVHFAIDQTDAFYASIAGYAMPETVFYDAKGNIVFQKHGDMTLEEMKTHTEEALAATK